MRYYVWNDVVPRENIHYAIALGNIYFGRYLCVSNKQFYSPVAHSCPSVNLP